MNKLFLAIFALLLFSGCLLDKCIQSHQEKQHHEAGYEYKVGSGISFQTGELVMVYQPVYLPERDYYVEVCDKRESEIK